jgi:DNA-directed RNA polymerase subunit H
LGLKLENTLVPKHEILKGKEAEKILNFYKVTSNELPRIQKDDPAIKDMNPKVGDIIQITRKSQSAGTALYYRVVIEG